MRSRSWSPLRPSASSSSCSTSSREAEATTSRATPDRDRIAHNRAIWSEVNAQFTDADAESRWQSADLGWGLFHIPETDVGALNDVAGARVVELGCGTAYLSAWLARSGAGVVGVDLSPAQLVTARRCQREIGPVFPLVEANAEHVPVRTGAVDLVVSEYGASPWCEPGRWVREAARLLHPGGRLVFLTNSVLAALCVPEEGGVAGDRLLRGPDEVARVLWPDGGIEHHPTHGEWVSLLRGAGFVIDALLELRPSSSDLGPDLEPGTGPEYYEIATAAWAARWPAEDLWVAHRS
jgi:SAM-dependent methyltransferase